MALPEELAVERLGATGYELLSSEAFRKQLNRESAVLDSDPRALDAVLDDCFRDPRLDTVAHRLACDYGKKLGVLLLTLKRGDPADRASRPEWGAAHWEYWRQITTFIVGGGMMAGELGLHAIPAAGKVLAEYGVDDVEVTLSEYGTYLPLVGLARTAPVGAEAMVVLDFGHSSIKRGLARFRNDELTALDVYPSLPAGCPDVADIELPDVKERWHGMLSAIVETWRSCASGDVPPVGISLVTYLAGGHPFPDDDGCYGALQGLAPHLATFVRDEIVREIRTEVQVNLYHDGTAAALAYAGCEASVVLTLGTSIGSGFVPAATGCRPVQGHAAIRNVETHRLPSD